MRPVDHESLVIILSLGGWPLEQTALGALSDVAVSLVRVEREGETACLAARVMHGDAPDAFRDRVRPWGAARGWAITVAASGRRGLRKRHAGLEGPAGRFQRAQRVATE